ncbi:hypothetical protein [Erythrobacter sp. R86502]|uniref:hypothetical protein n=1 Tax=Erythrobacter sp. R86502 TaxID=3093846 RepID=UPI0036D23A7E
MTRRKDPRTARLPVPAGELPSFTPVPRRCDRHDGWTPQRQRDFIEALADTGSVTAACKAVDMSTFGAYYLRRQPGAETFRAAWAAALQLGVQRVEDVVMDRALNGVEEPLYSYGKLVGTRTRYNDRLLMFILRNRAPERFAAGGGPKGLNAVSQMQLDRLKKQWIAEHEAGKRNVSDHDVRRSIDAKIESIRRSMEPQRVARWNSLSSETHAAWTRFVELRERDLAATCADEAARQLVNVEWDAHENVFTPSKDLKYLHDRLAQRDVSNPIACDGTDEAPSVSLGSPPEPEPPTL